MKIAITGGSGFIGSRLAQRLSEQQHTVTSLICRNPTMSGPQARTIEKVLEGQDVIVHMAALAHGIQRHSSHAIYRANHLLTENLARLAIEAGTKRVIYLSTAYVHGIDTDQRVSEESPLRPQSCYAKSKLLGEIALREATKESSTTYTIIRPPPVYGPGAPGNFRTLGRAIKNGFVIPHIHRAEKRSYISLENIVSFLLHSITCKIMENQTYLVSDKATMTFPEIVRRCAHETGRYPRLVPLPAFMIKAPLMLTGRNELYRSLFGKFEINHEKAIRTNWAPE